VESVKYFELYLERVFKQKINFIRNGMELSNNINDNEQSPLVKSLRIPTSLNIVKRQKYMKIKT
jgi:hypothetical protein